MKTEDLWLIFWLALLLVGSLLYLAARAVKAEQERIRKEERRQREEQMQRPSRILENLPPEIKERFERLPPSYQWAKADIPLEDQERWLQELAKWESKHQQEKLRQQQRYQARQQMEEELHSKTPQDRSWFATLASLLSREYDLCLGRCSNGREIPTVSKKLSIVSVVILLLGLLVLAQEGRDLVLVTYNIHHAEGVDGVLSLQRIADDVRHGDIIGLQEVDNHFDRRSEFANQAEALAELLNMYYVFGANLDLNGSTVEGEKIRNVRRQYGTAILSRYPIEFSRNYPLPKIEYTNLSSEQRGLLEGQIDVQGKKLRVYVTHLANTSDEQRILQVEALKEFVNQAPLRGAPQGNIPLASSYVVMGDFNFRPDSEAYESMTGEFQRGRQLRRAQGFIDFWPLVSEAPGHTIGVRRERGGRIDYFFVSPDLAALAKSASVNVETVASDHQPVTAVLTGF